jgi:hypothetical protein
MAEPLRPVDPAVWPVDTSGGLPSGPRWTARARRAVRGCLRAVLGWAVRPARLLPGLGAFGCAVAGSWLLWGLGVALLVAVPFLLLLDARTPRG